MSKIIEQYNLEENKALETTSNLIFRAFTTSDFNITNYPHKINSYPQIYNYIDTMHEPKAHRYFNEKNFLVDKEEKIIIEQINEKILNISKNDFNKVIVPISATLASIPLLRVIKKIKEIFNLKKVNIFEVGPGSGYFGIMNYLNGDKYISTENSQAFYIWQNILMKNFSKENDFFDYVYDELGNLKNQNLVHLPWWYFANNHFMEKLNVDIIICEHAIAELDDNALRYLMKLSNSLLKNNTQRPKFFIFTKYGGSFAPKHDYIKKMFIENNFQKINLSSALQIWVHTNNEVAKLASNFNITLNEDMTRSRIIKKYNRYKYRKIIQKNFSNYFDLIDFDPNKLINSKHEDLFSAHDLLNHKLDLKSKDYDFLDYIGKEIPKKINI